MLIFILWYFKKTNENMRWIYAAAIEILAVDSVALALLFGLFGKLDLIQWNIISQ